MDMSDHSLPSLFRQLGLPDAPEAIDQFILTHQGAPMGSPLHAAPCWTPSQAEFLREALAADADWAEVADALLMALQTPRAPS